ncbi:MAG: hypothetical protein OXC44_08385 [Proteobacteria bacterium]|nr:hypothetical protein [Pseudomonadota bacterium]
MATFVMSSMPIEDADTLDLDDLSLRFETMSDQEIYDRVTGSQIMIPYELEVLPHFSALLVRQFAKRYAIAPFTSAYLFTDFRGLSSLSAMELTLGYGLKNVYYIRRYRSEARSHLQNLI